MFQSNTLNIFACIFVLLVSGCSSTDHRQYYWGAYENVIYGNHIKPEEFSPQMQIDALSKDIEQAKANGKAVPPGLYAHLGMEFAKLGDLKSAINALETEKQLYPDSTVLIDGLLMRLQQNSMTTN